LNTHPWVLYHLLLAWIIANAFPLDVRWVLRENLG
jgi:hypothetical protein